MWAVAPCSSLEIYLRFRGTLLLPLAVIVLFQQTARRLYLLRTGRLCLTRASTRCWACSVQGHSRLPEEPVCCISLAYWPTHPPTHSHFSPSPIRSRFIGCLTKSGNTRGSSCRAVCKRELWHRLCVIHFCAECLPTRRQNSCGVSLDLATWPFGWLFISLFPKVHTGTTCKKSQEAEYAWRHCSTVRLV